MPYSLQTILDELHATYQPLSEGQVADYIPELAQANPDWFGICVVTTDGQIFSAGDVTQAFTVQSLSKPFAYGLALEDHGRDYLLSRIGVEPTGRAFNAISLDEKTRRPLNPMINAGAIAVDDLIKGADSATRIKRVREMMARYTGHPMHIDAAVYVSERETGHRNRAIAYLMRQFNMIDNIEDSLDLYFQQCAIIVNCCDLAMMAATLANGGISPATGEVALQPHCVRDVLSIMYTCGMYDSAGEWAYRVGLPGKSGVSGGLLAVVPGKMGIAVFSPPLDERGHSVRGMRVIEALSDRLLLHSFDMSQPD